MTEEKDKPTEVTDDEFKDELLHKLHDLRNSNFLCDTTVRAEGQNFSAHRIVLSAGSDYFKALFSCDLQVNENQSNLVELNMNSTTVAEVLKFIYTGEVSLTSSNAQDLVVASDYLMISRLKSRVAQFLVESVSISNCAALESFASQYNCDSLRQAAVEYQCQHFVAFVKAEDFLSLSVEQVRELVCKDELNIAEEEQVYEAVMAWVTHDLSSRECFLPDLLKCVRLFSMSKYSLRRILDTEKLITENLTCTAILNSGLDFFLFPDRFSDRLFKHRNSIEKEEYVITIIGGYEEGEYEFCQTVHCFALATNEWHLLSPLTNILGYAGGIYSGLCGGRVYVLSSDNFTTISCFNPQKNTWKSIETEIPGQIFSGFTVTSFRGDLYVTGGIKESSDATPNLHKYNPICNEWRQLASMEANRFGHCAVVLEDLIYAIGGSDGFGEQYSCLSSVECYDPFANQWRKVPDLNHARRLPSAASVGGKIVIVGGVCEMGDVTQAALEPSCEMFDPCLNQWSLVSRPVVPRVGCGIVSVEGTVYVFGGEVGGTHLDSVECFDLKCNEWHKVNTHMPVARSLPDASLLKLPKHFLAVQSSHTDQ